MKIISEHTWPYNEETFTTITVITTERGEFEGNAYYNTNEEKFPPSRMVGGEISRCRAIIKYYQDLKKEKKNILKGIKMSLGVIPEGSKAYYNIKHMYEAKSFELDLIEASIKYYNDQIAQVKKDRKKYTEFRSVSKEEREEMQKTIQEGFDLISKLNNKDKEVKEDK